jgi:type I restriction enzyme S subunit
MKQKDILNYLPENWIVAKLSDMVLDPNDDFVDGPFGSNLKASEYHTAGVPIFKIQNIKAGYFLDKNIQFVTPEKAEQLRRHSFRYGDIIITKLGEPLGLCCKVPAKYPNGIIVADLMRMRPSSLIVNTDYLVYAINSKIIQDQFKAITKGTTRSRVNLTITRDIEIPLAPLEEQAQIVSKLDEILSELQHSKEQMEIAVQQLNIYNQLILQHAFNGSLTNERLQENGIPEGWEIKRISELCDVVRGGSPRPAGDPKYYNGNIPFLKVADLTKDDNVYLHTFNYTIKEAGLKKTRQIKPDTLLLSNSGATLGVPKICMIDATMNDGVAAFLNLDKRSNLYLYYFWKSKTKELRNLNQGAAQPNLNTDIIKNYYIPYCSFEKQKQIVLEIEYRLSVSKNIEDNIAENLKKIEAIRQGVLMEAFQGKLSDLTLKYDSAAILLDVLKENRVVFLSKKKEDRKTKLSQNLNTTMIVDQKQILDLLKESTAPMPTKSLWLASIHKDDIDEFYADLKRLIESGEITELPRIGKESLISLAEKK